jgi:hypothetical protein
VAIIDITTGIIRGKLGNIVFSYRMGTNYARRHVPKKPPPSPAQTSHRKLYAQLQGLGSVWLNGLIKPFYQGDQSQECAYRQFIKYNWPRWDKQDPAWSIALPFWGYGDPPAMNVIADPASGGVTVDLFPPAPLGVGGCSPRMFQILRENFNWKVINSYTTLPDRHRAILPDAAGYSSGSWNLLAWYTAPGGDAPITDPVRG